MRKKFIIIVLAIILLLGATLRLYQLGSVPLSPDWDEVALAYNAHSLFQTGKDEFGTVLPPILRSFDDYKPAVYAYLAIPFVEIFGLTPFAVRLPSALMGLVAIFAVYFLVKELFTRPGNKQGKKYAEIVALIAAFSLAISPWHIQFSRVAFETNVGLTINILVALFILKGLRRPWLLLVAFFLAGVNLSVYQSERVFTPLLVITLLIIFRREILQIQKKYLISAILVGFVTILPIIIFFTYDQNAFHRVRSTSIFSEQTEVLKRTIVNLKDDRDANNYIGLLLDNRRIVYANTIASAYIAHFDPKWLFIQGDISRHHAPKMGLLYIIFLPFILLGIYQLLFGKYDKKTKYVIFSWFLLAAVPASITIGVPHAVRTLNFLPTYDIFIAIGIVTFVMWVWQYKHQYVIRPLKYALFSLLAILLFFNFVYYLNQYFVQQNYFYAYDWQYGYEKLIPKLENLKKNYKKIVVSEHQPLDKSYMFFLVYLKYPPEEYQKIVANNPDHAFDKYTFRTFQWGNEEKNLDVLYVGSPDEFPDDIIAEDTIYYPNGERAILIVDPEKVMGTKNQ